MRRIPTSALEPGMKVGHPIYNSRGDILINRDVILNDKYIKSLQRIGVPALYIIDDNLPEFYVGDVIDERNRAAAVNLARKILKGTASMKSPIDKTLIHDARTAVGDIVDQLLKNPSLMVNLVDIRSMDDYLFAHSINVCVLSLITGVSLGFNKGILMNLGMGALLHDIGKTLIPPHILNKPGSLSEEEFGVMKKHPEYGFTILANNESFIKKISAMIALQHHERYNGEGYPNGICSGSIDVLAQIVGMADVYDALTSDRVYRKAFPPYEAFRMLASSGDKLFDRNLLQIFLGNIAAYPSGTVVQLNSKEIAVVIETPKGFSLQPKIKILYDRDENKLEQPVEVELSKQKELTILSVLEHERIEELQKKTGKNQPSLQPEGDS